MAGKAMQCNGGGREGMAIAGNLRQRKAKAKHGRQSDWYLMRGRTTVLVSASQISSIPSPLETLQASLHNGWHLGGWDSAQIIGWGTQKLAVRVK